MSDEDKPKQDEVSFSTTVVSYAKAVDSKLNTWATAFAQSESDFKKWACNSINQTHELTKT